MLTLERTTDMNPTDHQHNQVPYGPLLETNQLSAGLDYYKPTMSQLQYEKYPDVEVTFTFKNRSQDSLAEYVDVPRLQARLDSLREQGWAPNEIDYFRSLNGATGERIFSDDYLGYLVSHQLPPVNVRLNGETNDIAIDAAGDWPLVTFWETIVMSEANEAYFEGLVESQGMDLLELYAEGDRRLDEKIKYFQANPDVKFADFGTRRRLSLRWHEHVVQRLAAECPDNFIGTSNVALAAKLGLTPIGTFAHEMPMVYAAIADATDEDIRASHGQMIDDWCDRYGDDLSTILTDTFGSDFFFESFTAEQAARAKGLRQDSGDPIAFGEKAIQMYDKFGIDPNTKPTTFSDNLNTEKVDRIHKQFIGRLAHGAGIGTFISNDLGIKPPNNVMKATHVRLPDGREAGTVKLSDDPGKHTGSTVDVARYVKIFATK